jgi:membrane-associated protein
VWREPASGALPEEDDTVDMTALVQGLNGPAVYAATGVFAFLESAAFVGLVVPGETALLLAGALAALGHASLTLMIATAVVGAILGDLAGYGMGRGLGPRLRGTRCGRAVGAARWDRADEMVRTRGPLAVFLGRWVGVLRALVPMAAGAARMPAGRFLLWNVLGGVSWATSVLVAGYLAGSSWDAVQGWLGVWAAAMTAVAVALVAAPVLRRMWQRHRTRNGAGLPEPAGRR